MGIAGLCLLSERDIKISLSMIRNDGRSINTVVGSAQAVFHHMKQYIESQKTSQRK